MYLIVGSRAQCSDNINKMVPKTIPGASKLTIPCRFDVILSARAATKSVSTNYKKNKEVASHKNIGTVKIKTSLKILQLFTCIILTLLGIIPTT